MNTRRLVLMTCLALIAGVLLSIQPAAGVISCSDPGKNPYNCAWKCDTMKQCQKCCSNFRTSNKKKHKDCLQRCRETFEMDAGDPPQPLPPDPGDSGPFGDSAS